MLTPILNKAYIYQNTSYYYPEGKGDLGIYKGQSEKGAPMLLPYSWVVLGSENVHHSSYHKYTRILREATEQEIENYRARMLMEQKRHAEYEAKYGSVGE